MADYITVADVRRASGVPSSLIGDTEATAAIDVVEPAMTKWLNTVFVPTQRKDILDGSGKDTITTRKNPLLALKALKSDGDTVAVSGVEVYKQSGMIVLGENADIGRFVSKSRSVTIKYLYGLMEESSTSTTTTSASVAGTAVALSVSSETGFSDDDWVEIYGMDGNKEVAQVSSTASSTITVDELLFAHESGSTVVKLQIPTYIKRFMEVEAAIYLAVTAMGRTYTFNASYNLGDLSVVKGVPYLHWTNSYDRLSKERDLLRRRISVRPVMAI